MARDTKKARTRELAHEILRPLGVDVDSLTEVSRINFEGEMRRAVERKEEDRLIESQQGWKRDEAMDDKANWTLKRMGR